MLKHHWTLLLLAVWLVSGSAHSAGVTLYWTAPGDDGHLGQATIYDLRYSEYPINDDNWESAQQADAEPYPERAGSLQRAWVGGLLMGQRYYFAIKTADEKENWSPLSNVCSKVAVAECTGTVGNVDCDPDDLVTMGDLTALIGHVFIDSQPLGCPGEANIDGDPDNRLTMSDVTVLIYHLFIFPQELRACPAD